jgi:hypothetical protein
MKSGNVPARRSTHSQIDLTDPPAFEIIAEACGAWGRRVTTIDALEPTLAEALEVVRSGTSAVVNVEIVASEKTLYADVRSHGHGRLRGARGKKIGRTRLISAAKLARSSHYHRFSGRECT